MSLSVDQKLNIAGSELQKAPASAYKAYRTFCECLSLNKNCASRILKILDAHLGEHRHETKWATLYARACFFAGRIEDASRLALELVLDALLGGAKPSRGALQVLESIAQTGDASVSSILRGKRYHAPMADRMRDVLTTFYLKGVLRGQVPPGIQAIRKKLTLISVVYSLAAGPSAPRVKNIFAF